MSLVYLNGVYFPAADARIPVTDRGLAYGDGVFTTIGVSGGGPRFLDWHLERLLRDAAALRIRGPETRSLADACRGLIARLGLEEGVVKVTVTRGTGGRGPSVQSAGSPTVIVTASGPPERRPPLRAITVPDTRGPLAAHKTLNYLPNVLALRQAEDAGRDEAVFVRDGRLVEATVSNLVGFADGVLSTPPLDGGVLPGVARRALLEAGAIAEGGLLPDAGGPLYCVNNVRGVEAVVELDGRPLERNPKVQRTLQAALDKQARLAAPG